jgi:hypothetical protein
MARMGPRCPKMNSEPIRVPLRDTLLPSRSPTSAITDRKTGRVPDDRKQESAAPTHRRKNKVALPSGNDMVRSGVNSVTQCVL